MGATIVKDKFAAQYCDRFGKSYFVLYEETYESNVYPQIPRWGASAFGEIADVMEFIFMVAACANDGLTRGPHGSLTASGVIKSWLQELKNPRILGEVEIVLKVGSNLDRTDLPAILDRLKGIGRQDLVDAIEQQKWPTINSMDDAKVIKALYGHTRDLMGVWRAFTSVPLSAYRDEAGGYNPPIKKEKWIPSGTYAKLPNDYLLCSQDGKHWKLSNSRSGVEMQQICELYALELRSPGSYLAAIKQIKQTLHDVAPVNPKSIVVIDKKICRADKYWREASLDAVRDNLEVLSETDEEMRVLCPTDYNDAYKLTFLPEGSTEWIVQEEESASESSFLQVTHSSCGEQLMLF